jgi:hypothetical protein
MNSHTCAQKGRGKKKETKKSGVFAKRQEVLGGRRG